MMRNWSRTTKEEEEGEEEKEDVNKFTS